MVACQVASRRDSDQQGGTRIDPTATDLESGMRLAASHNFRQYSTGSSESGNASA